MARCLISRQGEARFAECGSDQVDRSCNQGKMAKWHQMPDRPSPVYDSNHHEPCRDEWRDIDARNTAVTVTAKIEWTTW